MNQQSAETLAISVILSGAKNLGARIINMLGDSSSPAAPQNDIFGDFSDKLPAACCLLSAGAKRLAFCDYFVSAKSTASIRVGLFW